ncbi:hypothetical protein MRX96_017377 [Rhipicephalus microplus]
MECATLFLSTGPMGHPERERDRLFQLASSALSACPSLSATSSCGTQNVNGNALLQLPHPHRARDTLYEYRVYVAPGMYTVICFCNLLQPHRARAVSLSTGTMWHRERKQQYASATGFTRIEHVPLSLSTESMWYLERKLQFASANDFTRIECATLSPSTWFMWHAGRKRQCASGSGFTHIERVLLSLSTRSIWHPERKRQYASATASPTSSA